MFFKETKKDEKVEKILGVSEHMEHMHKHHLTQHHMHQHNLNAEIAKDNHEL